MEKVFESFKDFDIPQFENEDKVQLDKPENTAEELLGKMNIFKMGLAAFSKLQELTQIGENEKPPEEEANVYNLAIVFINSLITQNKKVNILPRTKKLIFAQIVGIFDQRKKISERILQYDVIYVLFEFRASRSWRSTASSTGCPRSPPRSSRPPRRSGSTSRTTRSARRRRTRSRRRRR